MSYSAAGLQTPILETVETRKHFIEKAGAVYGAIVAIGFMLFFWLPDAITLRQVSYQLWWGKLVLGLFASLCLCVPIGWLAARSRWSGISLLLWIVAGGLLAWIGGRVQFDGLSWLARLTDPYPSGESMYPFTPSAAAFTGFGIVVGAGAGLIIGLLSFLALDRAWNHATDRNGFSVRSIAMLCVCLPALLGFGLLADFQINSTPRTALTGVQREIEITRDPSVDLARARVISMRPFRGQLTPHYTLFWNKVSPDLVSTTIDTQFDNGLLLRCTQIFGNVLPCADLGKNLHDWMMQLVTVGHLTCMGCSVQVERSTLRWLNTTLPAIGNLQDVMLLQHQGGWIYMRAMFDSGRKIDCRFRGDQPIIVDLCVEVK